MYNIYTYVQYVYVLIQILNGRVKTCSIYAVVDGNFGGVTCGTSE